MTGITFRACFDAAFKYDEDKKLKIDSNLFDQLDDNGEKIPLLDDNGEQLKDDEGNLVFKKIKIGAKEILNNYILENSTLKDAGLFESSTDTDDGRVFEYEANLFDFKNDVQYEVVEAAAKDLISDIESAYTNTRGYTVGKYEAGNSFGIKIVLVIF